MFFVGILGVDSKNKEVKKLHGVECISCEQLGAVKLIKSYSYFHIFFIPIFKWNEAYYLLCEKCNSIYSISTEKAKKIEKDEHIELIHCDLKKINNNCRHCGAELNSNYRYCPYCGEIK